MVYSSRSKTAWMAVAFLSIAMTLACASPGTQSAPPGDHGPSPEETRAVAVAVVTITPTVGDLARQITLPGSLEPFQEATLYSKVAGYLEWIKVDIGDWTRKGNVIAKIEVPEMHDEFQAAEAEMEAVRAETLLTEAEIERAQAEYELKKLSFQRLQEVAEQEPEMISKQRLDESKAELQISRATLKVLQSRVRQNESQIKRTEANLNRLRTLSGYSEIKSPFDGIVTERFVHPGAFIQVATTSPAARPVAKVVRIDRLRLFVQVPEAEVPFVQEGDAAALTLDALPGREFTGQVRRFATVLDAATRTMKTEINIKNPKRSLLPGMYGEVTLELEENVGAITIPVEALRSEGNRKYVYCVRNSEARTVEVSTGLDDGIKVEITSGLSGDERIILQSRSSLREGVQVSAN